MFLHIIKSFAGMDSRFGVGFALGEFADVQLIVEAGPQTDVEKLEKAKVTMYDIDEEQKVTSIFRLLIQFLL